MEYPKLKFLINEDLDVWTASKFKVGTAHEVHEYYRLHSNELNDSAKEFKIKWDAVSVRFFSLTEKIFKNHPWPEGKYLSFPSIFNCNPRFLYNRTFQVYIKHKGGPVYVMMHEMLHFIFYDYAAKKHDDIFLGQDTESGIFWDVAEILDFLLLQTTDFVQLHGNNKPRHYQEHSNYIQKLESAWNGDIDELILQIYRTIQGDRGRVK